VSEYHKIQTIFKRDMASRRKTLREGDWTLPEFEYLARNAWTFTEKVDGTNIRVIFKDGAVAFGGRTEDAGIPVPRLRCPLDGALAQDQVRGWVRPGSQVSPARCR
jgi:hypothetical protein